MTAFDAKQMQNLRDLDNEKLMDECKYIAEKIIPDIKTPILFCHNDLNAGMFLYIPCFFQNLNLYRLYM